MSGCRVAEHLPKRCGSVGPPTSSMLGYSRWTETQAGDRRGGTAPITLEFDHFEPHRRSGDVRPSYTTKLLCGLYSKRKSTAVAAGVLSPSRMTAYASIGNLIGNQGWHPLVPSDAKLLREFGGAVGIEPTVLQTSPLPLGYRASWWGHCSSPANCMCEV